MLEITVWVLIAAFHLVGFGAALHVLATGRTSQGTIAWVMSLVLLPYIALPMYLVFGPYKFTGYVAARRLGKAELNKLTHGLVDEADRYRASIGERTGALQVAEQLAAMPSVGHNSVTLLIDGDATFESIFRGIESAQHYVLVQFYIVHDDELGRALKTRLMAKAKSGVAVYFLYDDVGSNKLPRSYIDDLKKAGVKTSSFGIRGGKGSGFFGRFRLNFRNHRKIVVADGERAWVGGHNVGDEYMGKDPKLSPWRDTHVEIEGPAALGPQLTFLEDWYWATHTTPELRWTPRTSSQDVSVLALPSGPADEVETCGLSFVQAINAAQHRVWIVSPYFVPDEAVIASLQLAVMRGVDVRILIPALSDSKLVWLAAYSYLPETDGVGVKVYRFENGFLHQKVVLVDDAVAAVGTANFDNRSFRINFEIMMIVHDTAFAREVEAMLEADFAKSTRFTVADLETRPWTFRLATRVARLFAPTL